MVKRSIDIFADILETNAFIQYHNYLLGCGDQWLYKYAVTLRVRSEIKKLHGSEDAVEDVPSLVCALVDMILGDLESYEVLLSEAGRKNAGMYEDNLIRWAIEYQLDKRRPELLRDVDDNKELKTDIKNRITRDLVRVFDAPDAAVKEVVEFWYPENLKSYSIQIGEDLVYSQAQWREDNKYRL